LREPRRLGCGRKATDITGSWHYFLCSVLANAPPMLPGFRKRRRCGATVHFFSLPALRCCFRKRKQCGATVHFFSLPALRCCFRKRKRCGATVHFFFARAPPMLLLILSMNCVNSMGTTNLVEGALPTSSSAFNCQRVSAGPER